MESQSNALEPPINRDLRNCGYLPVSFTSKPPCPRRFEAELQRAGRKMESGSAYPRLSTARFALRPFLLSDIRQLTALAGKHRIADTTVDVPYPYTKEFARRWIASHDAAWERRQALHWAVVNRGACERMVGYAGLVNIDGAMNQAELRFWIGCGVERTRDGAECCAAVIRFALVNLRLNRLNTFQVARHPLAGHVLAAIGMHAEGPACKRIFAGDRVEDVICWTTLLVEWQGHT